MTTAGQRRISSNWLSGVALAMAGGSLLLSGGLALRQRSASPACVCEEGQARPSPVSGEPAVHSPTGMTGRDALMGSLALRVTALEAAADRSPRVDAPKEPAATDRPRRKFETGNEAVAVRETSRGNYAVTNTDPSLTGTRLNVTGRGADGTSETFSIVVPPPEK